MTTKITRLIYRTILVALLTLSGCEHDFIVADEEMAFRQIAWNALSEWKKETVIGGWRKAKVQDEPLPFQGKEVVSVTFRTTLDGLLGPIVVFN